MEENTIPFIKMQGAGNDFVIIDNRQQAYSLEKLIELTPMMCNRRYGVGADGLMALNLPENDALDYTMIYRNADGSDAGMCGNGSRCLALYASRLGLGQKLKFNVHDDVYKAEVKGTNQVLVSFPGNVTVTEVKEDDDTILYQVHPGTEHIVRQVAEPTLRNEKQLAIEGQRLRKHPRFQPEGTNINFMYGQDKEHISIQTYERGVEGLTLACGTGAIASALAWHFIQQSATARNTVDVETKGGNLKIHFTYDAELTSYSDIELEGPAHFVFKGSYYVQ